MTAATATGRATALDRDNYNPNAARQLREPDANATTRIYRHAGDVVTADLCDDLPDSDPAFDTLFPE